MNTFKTSLIAKSIAAACFAAAVTGPAVAQFREAPPVDRSGTPNDGLVCRGGYTPNFSGSSLKCSKTTTINVQVICPDPAFDKYVARVSAGGTPLGEDVCIKTGNQIRFDSDDRIGGGSDFQQGRDWVLAKADKVRIAEKTAERDLQEAAAFGGTAADVETVAGEPVFNRQATIDTATVTLTHFTFAIPTGGLGNPGPVGLPATTNSTSAFAPKPLPR